MRRKWVGCLGLPVVLFAVCAGFFTWKKHVPDIDDATADELLTYANQVWEPPTGKKDDDWWVLYPKESDWPDAVRRMRPESVRVAHDGMHITLGGFFVESWGYFVLPDASTFDPRKSSDPWYRPLRGRVYRFHVAG